MQWIMITSGEHDEPTILRLEDVRLIRVHGRTTTYKIEDGSVLVSHKSTAEVARAEVHQLFKLLSGPTPPVQLEPVPLKRETIGESEHEERCIVVEDRRKELEEFLSVRMHDSELDTAMDMVNLFEEACAEAFSSNVEMEDK